MAVVFASRATTIGRHLQRTVHKWMHRLIASPRVSVDTESTSLNSTTSDIVDQIRERAEADQRRNRAIEGARELEEKALLCIEIANLMHPKLKGKEREDKALLFMHSDYSDLIMLRSKLKMVKSKKNKLVLKSRYDLILRKAS